MELPQQLTIAGNAFVLSIDISSYLLIRSYTVAFSGIVCTVEVETLVHHVFPDR